MSFEEIKLISTNRFNNILNERIKESSLSYLTGKQNTKGGDIIYTKIEMSEYLSHNVLIAHPNPLYPIVGWRS